MKRIGVLGAGSFGTALAIHCARHGMETLLWARSAEMADGLNRSRVNERYLPAVELPPTLAATAELGALDGCSLVLVAVPSHGFREVVRNYFAASGSREGLTMVSASKGIETDGHARMSEVLKTEAARAGREVAAAALSGPTFAGELARGVASAAVVAAETEEVATTLCAELASPSFRLYSSTDLAGVELGGATKNVIAIGAGMIHGLGLEQKTGQNTQAALITRGLHELTRLGVACGGRPSTFSGLAGLGDLVLTCTGGASRNRAAGESLARGLSLDDIRQATHSVAEGLVNARSVASLAADRGVEVPITEQMNAVIYEGKPPAAALAALMTRDLKAETQ